MIHSRLGNDGMVLIDSRIAVGHSTISIILIEDGMVELDSETTLNGFDGIVYYLCQQKISWWDVMKNGRHRKRSGYQSIRTSYDIEF